MGQVKEARAMRLNISEGERLSYGLIAPEQTTLLKGGFDCAKIRVVCVADFDRYNIGKR